jgi:cytochrome P450 family 142 subfamily A polypeptide 1
VSTPSNAELISRARFADGDFYAYDPFPVYEALRSDAPVHRDPESGLWGLASYETVEYASTHPAIFSSANGSRPFNGANNHMIDMDNPAHIKRRGLVSKGFTPRRISEHEPRLRQLCDDIIDTVCERGSCELVHDIAAQLPMIVIGDMLGVLPEDRRDVLQWSEDLLGTLGVGDEDLVAKQIVAATSYHEYATKVIAERKATPADDLISILLNAEIDGQRLTDEDVVGETLLILIGGDETTRHVIAGGMEALMRNPQHWQSMLADRSRIPQTVEEMLRWVSPIKNMCRTLTRDYEIGGAKLSEGDQALLLYESANYDEGHFEEPTTFNPDREPNDHMAFGVGAHFCLGSNLAKLELRVLLDRMLDRLPDIALASDEPLTRRRNNFISGIERMPVTFTATAPLGDGQLVLA